VSQEQLDKILDYIDLDQRQGANLITGGHCIGDQGFFVAPMVFDNVRDDMQVATDEIFGPVVSVLPFKDVNEQPSRATHGARDVHGYTLTVPQASELVGRYHVAGSQMCICSLFKNDGESTQLVAEEVRPHFI
jgi:acyl-CoA reductase-like NAD-dependent aldehyde dehydrogenase